jgi:hypothetical protein
MTVYSSLPTNEENDHDGSIVEKWTVKPRRAVPSWYWAWGLSFAWTVVNLVGSIFLLTSIYRDDRLINPAGLVPKCKQNMHLCKSLCSLLLSSHNPSGISD